MKAIFILYVRDQKRSCAFYHSLLGKEPILDVPGMTEFVISDTCKLGLMPESGIKRLLGDAMPDPAEAGGIPRAEVYLQFEDASKPLERAKSVGAKLLSELKQRDWGDRACYLLDPDGHVVALADANNPETT